MCVHMPVGYTPRMKRGVFFLSILLNCVVVMVNFVAFLDELPIPEDAECTTFSCLLVKTQVFTFTRWCGGLLNTITGSVFLLILLRLNRSLINSNDSQNTKRANFVAFVIVLIEFFLNFLPQLIVLLANWYWNVNVASVIGPYNAVLSPLEALISSLLYSNSLKPRTHQPVARMFIHSANAILPKSSVSTCCKT
ncbi:serpentine type 7TM GPCR chemoreceptor srbc domain-containing protein [Ditylenchus destructor]|uniref:Serpentine type 7TM GPCR chemoreceptor srbc domain-containing protein n=1 Tax=Ditylenchus destructor TaxID=166010 RepID=A0AAD4MSL3_9BILA|nr:serpentine type 7TM GPCR chemoreceptor srbc domain-containing protein [Ditylenchus destructor]